ncbi:hypothetical protein [Cytophaga hutchinsonii]|uniref:Lipocalin-like domain-containing protein n=1 Tax=Cytophaga hutchinsonii (strain ATCC 33406 / DSM 1761 / CIP 103989 / NBRC 15051 / NCIMB 9469 / D465) TaxID=269798 RepID=A0A6N4SMM2_CYTH3|nr:hypothetical protein [Cytophaga hutchinsonii]ABG57527.1 hypothetical protein CHU_0235 [Cytophaga hutchinsonii ATCC 33406]SFW99213.1 hypothetical protein SAMN04487930_10187 [Cytophaga hutchinsonii ATCC 33406]
MKKAFIFNPVVWGMYVLILFLSCIKDKETIMPSSQKQSTPEDLQENLSGKWIVNKDPLPNTREISTFTFFEFSAEKKFIVFTQDTIYFGTYSINSSLDTITLPGLGILAIHTLDAAVFNFSLKQEGEDNFNKLFTTFEDPTIPSSVQTDLLCKKMWTINWQYKDVPDRDTIYFDGSNWLTSIDIYFSRNGTYFLHNVVEGGNNINSIKTWSWQDVSETAILAGSPEPIRVMKLTDTEFYYSFKDGAGDTYYASASR